MTRFELLSLILSAGALLASGIAIFTSRRADHRSLEIQARQSEIDEARYARELSESSSALVTITSSGDHLYIQNSGAVSALDVTLEFDPPEDRESPIMEQQLEREFPVSELAPGGTVTLILAKSLGSASSQVARWSWKQPNGELKTQRGVIQF